MPTLMIENKLLFKLNTLFWPLSNLNPTIFTYRILVKKDLADLPQTLHVRHKNLRKAKVEALKNLESR